jgi:hypothetical protein
MLKSFLILSFALLQINLVAQDVKISKEISIKNADAYDLLKVNDNIVFYRDNGGEYFFDIFDINLNFKRSSQIYLDEKKGNVDCIHSVDSNLIVYYSYKLKDTMFLKAVRYDKNFNKSDTITIVRNEEYFDKYELKYILSKDKSKVMFFFIDDKKLNCYTFDTKNFMVLNIGKIQFKDESLLEGFEEVALSNDGHGFFLFEENNNSWFKEMHKMQLLSLFGNNYNFSIINMEKLLSTGTLMTYDDVNKNVIIAGLYSEKSSSESHGYFSIIMSDDKYKSIQYIYPNIQPHDNGINQDLEGINKKARNNNVIQDFYAKAIVPRQDGGFVLITELQREFSRRMNTNMATFDRAALSRPYTDFYSDDLLLWSVNPNNTTFWRKALFKKQFSQDDEGIYSSFLVLKNPSAVHIVFNDEIKNNSTVSEYVIDPLGNYKRKSVLSTEYRNLRLKFKEGFQIGSKSFIVLSERSGRINLVKVDI